MSSKKDMIVYMCITRDHFQALLDLHFPAENAVLIPMEYIWEDDVQEFEHGDLVSRIEYLYTGLPLLVKYHRKLTSLKWAHTLWNGVDMLTKTFLPNEPIPKYVLTRTLGDINAGPVAEYVIGYIIARERAFFKRMDAQSKCTWLGYVVDTSERNMCHLTIGILGVGGIGKQVAKICKAFGMTVWGLTKRPVTKETACPDIDVYVTPEKLPVLLEHCDYVCCILPATPDTDNLLGGDMLAHCQQKGASHFFQKSVLINVGRGNIIDEDTIVKAINEGWIGGAILDVFPTEPLPPTSALWTLPGVIITPHISGWSWGDDHLKKVHGCFLENYRRYTKGAPLLGSVDWKLGY